MSDEVGRATAVKSAVVVLLHPLCAGKGCRNRVSRISRMRNVEVTCYMDCHKETWTPPATRERRSGLRVV